MFNFKDIIISNNHTFYDYSTGKQLCICRVQLLKLLVAAAFAIVFSSIKTDFLTVVLSTYAILAGFGFNILFYLLNFERSVRGSSLEDELIAERVNKLAKEIFYNVAYFNLVAVTLIILCLTYYLIESVNSEILPLIVKLLANARIIFSFTEGAAYISLALKTIYNIAFYYALIESLFTFARITSRTFFLFKNVVSND